MKNININIVRSVDNSSSDAQRPATCSRDPKILLNAQHYCSEIGRSGSREQVAGRRSLNCQQTLVKSAITTFLAMATIHAAMAAPATPSSQNTEKCYGIVKAGLNDCATATSSCAGSAAKDKQADAFIFLPKGVCDKLAGGNLKTENK